MFDFPEHIGEPVRGTQPHQQMNMIGGAADGLGHAVDGAYRAAKIRVQSFAPRVGDQWLAVFRAEDEVIMKAQMC